MESKPVETENKCEGDEHHQLSPTIKPQQQEFFNSKKNSPLVFLKKRVKSGGKKRRDSGHSDGDYESVSTIDEERSVDAAVASPSVESTAAASRRLSLDSASSQQSAQQQQQAGNKEKPRRGIAKVFHDLKHRSRVRKSHSAPPAAMDNNQVSSPVSTVDDDSFSSYATPMEAHSSGYSTPLFESNMASPRTSLSESFVEEEEEQDGDETTTLEASHSPAQVASVLANPPSEPASPPASSASVETLSMSIPKASPSKGLETEPVDAGETLESSNIKPDCRRTETEQEAEAEASPVATSAIISTSSTSSSSSSSATSPPTEATTLTTIAGQRSRIPLLSQHRASVPCSSTVSHPTAEALKGLQQQADRASSVSEVRFCFSEYVNGETTGASPAKGFIRSLPTADPRMDPATAGNDANGYPKNEHLYKVLVIGELGTGKTSIIKRYVHQFFSQHYRATIGVDFALKVVHWDQSTVIRLQLWDIAGQERFGNMTRVYYKEAVGAFIVFDVTRGSTFESVAKWKQDLDTKVQLPDGSPIPCVLLANKCDQPKEGIAASPAKLDEYCKEKGFAGWFETSAKDNINIDDAAKFLVGTILQNDQWSGSVKEEDADKLELNGKGGTAAGDKKKSGCC